MKLVGTFKTEIADFGEDFAADKFPDFPKQTCCLHFPVFRGVVELHEPFFDVNQSTVGVESRGASV